MVRSNQATQLYLILDCIVYRWLMIHDLFLHGLNVDILYSPHVPHEQTPNLISYIAEEQITVTTPYLYGANLDAISSISFSGIYFHLPPPLAFILLTSLPTYVAIPRLYEPQFSRSPRMEYVVAWRASIPQNTLYFCAISSAFVTRSTKLRLPYYTTRFAKSSN